MFCKCEIAILDASKNVKLTAHMVTNVLSCSNFSNYYEFAFTGPKLVHYFHTMKGLVLVIWQNREYFGNHF